MAEITKPIAKKISEIFCPVYNKEFNTDFQFDSIIKDMGIGDIILSDNKDNNKKVIKLEVVEAMSTRDNPNNESNPKELSDLKKFENSNDFSGPVIHMQTDELQLEEAIGHKANKYTIEEQENHILIIYKSLFNWDKEKIKEFVWITNKKIYNDFFCIYLVSFNNYCERLK